MFKKLFSMLKHDCSEVARKIELLLDGELDSQEEKVIIAEVQRCSHCLEHYNLDKAFKEFLARKVERKCCTETIKNEIREKISSLNLEEE